MLHHITRATRHLIFWSLIAVAVGMTGIRLILSGIEDYKARLTSRVSVILDTPVSIGHLGAAMRGFRPELVLSDIDVSSTVSRGSPAIQLKEIRMGIDLLEMVISRNILASSWVTLVGAKLSIKRKLDGSFAIVGLKAGDSEPLWLLQGSKYEVLHSDITWQDEQKNGRPLTFESVDMAVINEGDRHRFNVLMRLPEKYGDALRVSMDFKGNVFKPADLQGRAYMEGENIRLPEWVTVDLPLDVNLSSGSGDFKFWAEWRHSKLISLSGAAQLNNLDLKRQETGKLPIEHLTSQFQLTMNDKRWRLDVPRFLLETPDSSTKAVKKWPDAVFSIAGWSDGPGLPERVSLYAESLDLHEFSLIAQFFLPASDKKGKLLRQAQVKGFLRDFSLFAVPDEKTFAVNGEFSNVSLVSLLSAPGFGNLTGQIRGDDKAGTLRLETHKATLSSALFREPLAVDRLSGMLHWLQKPDEWLLSSSELALDSLSFKSKNRVQLTIAKTDGQAFMDFQSSFVADDASQISHYQPVKIMDEEVVDWLDHAFIKGRVSKGGLLFYGNLTDFPFTDGSGVFEAFLDVDQLEMNYHPDWPHLTGMGGEVLFYQDSFSATLHRGSSNDLSVRQAQVSISSLQNSPQVSIRGDMEGDIGRALGYLQKTPLKSRVDKLVEATSSEGKTLVDLDLKLPLRTGADVIVSGSATLNNAKITVNSLNLPVNQVNGLLRFNTGGIYSETIKAHTLGHPIRAVIESDGRTTRVNVDGHAAVKELEAQFKMPWWQLAEGETDYRLQLRLPYEEASPELYVESNLEGIALNLPASLVKTREQKKPFSLTFDLADKFYLPVVLNYDDKLKAAVKIDIDKQTILSGNILVGEGEVFQRREPGIGFEINSEKLALQDWLSFALADSASGGLIDDVKEVKLHAGRAFWRDAELGGLDLELKKDIDYWEGRLDSAIAKGGVKLPVNPKGAGRMRLDFETLELSYLDRFKSARNISESASSPDSAPDFFPILSVTSKQTLWQSVPLGRFLMETERIPNGLIFKRFELIDADQKLSATGDWKVTGSQSLTEFKGSLELPKGDGLFSKLGISNNLADTRGTVNFNLNWQAPPYRFALEDLKGQLDVAFKSGRILGIEPGFGRVLGILAMAQWLKRIQLDFSDVYREGLSFNSIKGHFDLAGGKAVTHNLIVDAVPAKINLSGETDLINQTVDYIVDVTPKSAEAVPIAGTIMGKVAALVAKSLTGEEQEGFFFGSQFLVKGDWKNAQIRSLHENEGLLQKTWNSITDFPWLKQQDTKK
ncbi:MAG: YhdP family protein [Gammaproteobacteria bacterium]